MDAYTITQAGHLKAKLQVLCNLLTGTPFEQHRKLQFDEVLRQITLPTCVNGAEQLYLATKDLTRPDEIPNIYARAYTEVVWSRHFTNTYSSRPLRGAKTIAARFAPTFSSIKSILCSLDVICDTSLEEIFRTAETRGKCMTI